MSPLRALRGGRGHRAAILAWAATIAVSLMVASWVVGSSINGTADDTSDNCLRIHLLVRTLDQLIASGRDQAIAYQRDGTITPAQLNRALGENDKSRRKLGEADCPPRAALTP